MEPGGNDSFCFPSSGLSSVQGLNPTPGANLKHKNGHSSESHNCHQTPCAPHPHPVTRRLALLWQTSHRALGMPSPVPITLQGYRGADSVVLGLDKETCLRYKAKMSKGTAGM